jgi:hypothetical protein
MKAIPFVRHTALAASLLALTACASNPLAGNSNRAQEARHTTLVQTVKGAGVGCALGAATGLFAGGLNIGNLAKRCAIGGAAGAVVGGVLAYQHESKAYEDLAAQARAAGAQAQVVTRTVVAKNAAGRDEQTQAVESLPIHFDDAATRAQAPQVQALLVKVARMADQSKTPVTITVVGPAQDRAWMVGVLKANLRWRTTATVREAFNADPGLVLSPVPDVGARR